MIGQTCRSLRVAQKRGDATIYAIDQPADDVLRWSPEEDASIYRRCFAEFEMFKALISCLVIAGFLTTGYQSSAQQTCVRYQLVPRTVFETQKVTAMKEVMETQFETQRTTSWKPVWVTEQRERRYEVLKPVMETTYRDETYTVLKPVRETGFREQSFEETTWETTTEMRDEQIVQDKPVVETSFREEQIMVRKPVTEQMMKVENVTVLRPVTSNETQLVPGSTLVGSWGVATQSPQTRLRWLPRTNEFNPFTGQSVFRRGGFHWVRDPGGALLVLQASVVPTLTPQSVQRTTLVPETVVRKEPVEVTRYVDELTTRKVPVQSYRTERTVTTRKVPVQVQKPVTRIVTKRTPVERVTYQKQEMVRRVPTTTQSFQRVERVEPYEVQVCRWEQVEQDVRVPRTVTRRVPVETTQLVPRTVMVWAPVDAFGRIVQTAPVNNSIVNLRPIDQRSTVLAQRPAVNEERLVYDGPRTNGQNRLSDRVEVRRPAVQIREIPGSDRVVFPESETVPREEGLQPITAKKPPVDETGEEGSGSKADEQAGGENEEFIGRLRDENAAPGYIRPPNDEDESNIPTPPVLETEKRESEAPMLDMPELGTPKRPDVRPQEDQKVADPIDT